MKPVERTDDERRAAAEMVRDGKSLAEVARTYQVSAVSVLNWCKRFGVKPGPGAWTGAERRVTGANIGLVSRSTSDDRRAVAEAYRAGASVRDLAAKYDRQKNTILSWLTREGVDLRGRSEAMTLKHASAAPPVPAPPPAKVAVAERPTPGRRFTDTKPLAPERVIGLDAEHAALAIGRTLFPTTVVAPDQADRLLVSGANSRKLGDRIVKGEWSGFPIYQLSLEERATCPRSCHHWSTCYGNGMPLARRHAHGPELVARLDVEIADLSEKHGSGFAIRLHTLGDFYSLDYVKAWAWWLIQHKQLRVFGFSAWPAGTPIGDALRELSSRWWSRFAIRFSSRRSGPAAAVTIDTIPTGPRVPEGIVCPAQTGATGCCGECGLCWSPSARDETIVFVLHGMKGGGRPPAAAPSPAPAPVAEPVVEPVAEPALQVATPAPVAAAEPIRPAAIDRPAPPPQAPVRLPVAASREAEMRAIEAAVAAGKVQRLLPSSKFAELPAILSTDGAVSELEKAGRRVTKVSGGSWMLDGKRVDWTGLVLAANNAARRVLASTSQPVAQEAEA